MYLIGVDEQPIDTYLIVIEYDPSRYNPLTDNLGTFNAVASNNNQNGQINVSKVTWMPRMGMSYLVVAAANSPCTEDHCPAARGEFTLIYEAESVPGAQRGPSLMREVVSDNFMIQNMVIQHHMVNTPPSIRVYLRSGFRSFFNRMLDDDPTALIIDYFLENEFRIPWW